MCQYLFAECTLKDKGDGLTDEQSEAIERWRGVLRGIAIEEMLHLALVANLMSSIGAAPYLGRPNFPQRSGYFPASVQLDLLPFGEPGAAPLPVPRAARGDGAPGRRRLRADGAVARAAERVRGDAARAGVPHRRTPVPRDRGRADEADARLGERALFVGSPRAQATPELFHWPQLVAVTDLDSALRGDRRDHRAGRGRPRRLGRMPTTAASSGSGTSTTRSATPTRRSSRRAPWWPRSRDSRSTSRIPSR